MASAVIGALRATLGLDSVAFQKGLADAQRSLNKAGKAMRNAGRSMTMYVSAPIAAFGALTLKSAGDFEQGMNRVKAVTGATGSQFDALVQQAKDLGRTTQFSASQAADAMGFLGMAGFKADQILGAMPGTLQLAASANLDLGTTADIVSNVLQGYGKNVSDLSHVNDVLVKAFTASNTNLQQLGEAMKYAGPVASAAGVKFETAAAALGLMGNAGIQASMAGTSLRGAITRMLNPTKQVRDAMAEANLTFKGAHGRLLPLDQIIQQLEPHADDAGLMMKLFGQRAGPAMAALVEQGSGSLRDMTKELENSGGTAQKIADVQMQGFNGQMRALKSAFEGLQLAIASSGLLEFATKAATALTTWTQELAKTNPEILKWGTVLAGVAAVLGPLVITIGLFATGIAAISAPVALVVAGIAGLTAAVVAFWPQIVQAKDKVAEFAASVPAKLQAVVQAFIDMKDRALQAVKDLVMGVKDWLGAKLDAAIAGVQGVGERIAAPFKHAWDAVVGHSWIPDLVKGVESWLGRLAVSAPARAQAAGDGVKNAFKGVDSVAEKVGKGVNGAFGDIGSSIAGLIDGTKTFKQVLSDVLTSLSRSIFSSIHFGGGFFGNLLQNVFGGLIGANANGTNNWRGGLTRVNERGGEIMNLPSGTQIIPNDISRQMAGGANGGVSIGDVYVTVPEGTDPKDAMRIGTQMRRQLEQMIDGRLKEQSRSRGLLNQGAFG